MTPDPTPALPVTLRLAVVPAAALVPELARLRTAGWAVVAVADAAGLADPQAAGGIDHCASHESCVRQPAMVMLTFSGR